MPEAFWRTPAFIARAGGVSTATARAVMTGGGSHASRARVADGLDRVAEQLRAEAVTTRAGGAAELDEVTIEAVLRGWSDLELYLGLRGRGLRVSAALQVLDAEPRAPRWEAMLEALRRVEPGERIDGAWLGRALQRVKDRPVTGLVLRARRGRAGAARWTVERLQG